VLHALIYNAAKTSTYTRINQVKLFHSLRVGV